ncbi:MAG: hypothetical protein KAS72_02905 [Phycisphaerales bacterium]|nr:hypothetical protein [Phycisphaerales bacterium]
MVRAFQIGLAVILLLAAAPQPASAQESDSQLRRQNEQLREENQRLLRELSDMKKRLTALEEEVAQIKRLLAQTPGEPAKAPDAPVIEPAPLPDDPMAAPDALFATLAEAYDSQFGDPQATAGQNVQQRRRAVERWCQDMNRLHRADVMWIVRYERLRETSPSDLVFEIVVLDPATGEAIGGKHAIPIRSREARLLKRFSEDDLLVLHGTFSAAVRCNEDREEPGMFNHPRFIGRYAEFGFDLVIRSIDAYEPPAKGAGEAKTEPGK